MPRINALTLQTFVQCLNSLISFNSPHFKESDVTKYELFSYVYNLTVFFSVSKVDLIKFYNFSRIICDKIFYFIYLYILFSEMI